MPGDIPYMPSVGNLPKILDKIRSAQTPPRFSYDFLRSNLGFSSSNDRPVIKVLKTLGFLTADSRPTPRYNEFRAQQGKSAALAQGLREGWADIFLSDQNAHQRSSTELIEIFKNATGKSESVAKKMATTFRALADQADFRGAAQPSISKDVDDDERDSAEEQTAASEVMGRGGLSLHTDVHVHLPATSDVAVYTAIFRALREELLD